MPIKWHGLCTASREGVLIKRRQVRSGSEGYQGGKRGLELLAKMVYEANQEMNAKEQEQRTAETTDEVILRKVLPELDSEELNNGRTSI